MLYEGRILLLQCTMYFDGISEKHVYKTSARLWWLFMIKAVAILDILKV